MASKVGCCCVDGVRSGLRHSDASGTSYSESTGC